MRMRGTKERRRERYEFIYKYRDEMAALVDHNKTTDDAVKYFVEQKARPELTYSLRTYFGDIFCTLRRDYTKIFLNTNHKNANKKNGSKSH